MFPWIWPSLSTTFSLRTRKIRRKKGRRVSKIVSIVLWWQFLVFPNEKSFFNDGGGGPFRFMIFNSHSWFLVTRKEICNVKLFVSCWRNKPFNYICILLLWPMLNTYIKLSVYKRMFIWFYDDVNLTYRPFQYTCIVHCIPVRNIEAFCTWIQNHLFFRRKSWRINGNPATDPLPSVKVSVLRRRPSALRLRPKDSA